MLKIFNCRSDLNTVVGIALAYALTVSPVYAGKSNDIANGIAAYKKGSYDTALRYLTLAETKYPKNALVHYYKANTLVYLMKVPEAMTEYNLAVELDPNHTVGQYAKQALAEERLIQHADELSNNLLTRGQEKQTDVLAEGQKEYADIHQHEESESRSMSNEAYQNGNIEIPVYGHDDIALFRQVQEREADSVLGTAERDSKAISSQATERANAIKNSAAALAQQLADSKASGGAKLSPLGTNLYVRNYTDTSLPK